MVEKKYYVYEWYRIEDNHVFYVGKGCGGRFRRIGSTSRNRFFSRYIKKYPSACRIVQNGLSEKEAYHLEDQKVREYKNNNCCECHLAETSDMGGGANRGELNGMYHKSHSTKVKALLREINSDGRHKGKNNSQYGVSPSSRMSNEQYKIWREKQRQRKNGATNPNAHKTTMIDVITKKSIKFPTTMECAKYLQTIPEFSSRYNSLEKLRYVIKHSNKTRAIYYNQIFLVEDKKTNSNIDDTVSSLSGREIRKIPPYSRRKM